MKKLLLVIAIMIAALQSFSQTDLIRQKLDSVFQYIDKTQIPTGYLKEYGAENPGAHPLPGQIKTTYTGYRLPNKNWFTLYNQTEN